MGYYIETAENFGKAAQLMAEFPSIVNLGLPSFLKGDDVVVCVVQNPWFDAAAIIFSENELQDFNLPSDFRKKTWLRVPKTVIQELVGKGRCPASVLNKI